MSNSLTHGSPVSTTFSITVPNAAGGMTGAIRVIATAIDPSFTREMNGTGTFVNGEVEDYFMTYTTTLPVILEKFSASTVGKCAARLEWITSTEENSDRYEVQRSSDGIYFETIGRINSSNSPAGNNYSYADDDVVEGRRYYRLRMVDIDGSAQYSNTVTVRTECGINIQLSPNPVTSIATITGTKSGDRIRVMGSDGRMEMERVSAGNIEQVNMSGLPGGVHLVQVLRDGVVVSHIKITKM
jgi:hypothetical protein